MRIFFLTLFILIYQIAFTCTTAVISGKYTADGKPMIWKLRDTDTFENKLKYFNDGQYSYIGLINSSDSLGENVWGGANSADFCIMNSASFNVNINDSATIKDREGVVMKLALQNCTSLTDFEQLLNNLHKPMGLAAHFGVIDAFGGAAFYEVNNYNWTKFDANNSSIAPEGYIIRTNFSFTGAKDVGYGFIRFQTAQSIFSNANATNQLNYKNILQHFSRCFIHPILKKDYRTEYYNKPCSDDYVSSDDLITRYGSASNILIRGANKDVKTDFSTIWTMVGFPNTCLAIPTWVKVKNKLPNSVAANGAENPVLNNYAAKLKQKCYPISRSDGYHYLKISELFNSNSTGIIQQLEAVEDKIFSTTEKYEKKWKNKFNEEEAVAFYAELDEIVDKIYLKLINN